MVPMEFHYCEPITPIYLDTAMEGLPNNKQKTDICHIISMHSHVCGSVKLHLCICKSSLQARHVNLAVQACLASPSCADGTFPTSFCHIESMKNCISREGPCTRLFSKPCSQLAISRKEIPILSDVYDFVLQELHLAL